MMTINLNMNLSLLALIAMTDCKFGNLQGGGGVPDNLLIDGRQS